MGRINHNSETSKLYKQRYKSQCIINDKLKEQNEELEDELATLKSAVIRIHNQSQLAGAFPHKQTMVDIINICDLVL